MLNKICEIVREAGEIYRRSREQFTVEEKGSVFNLVTDIDKKIQEFLVSRFSALVPGAHFLDEEGEDNKTLTDGVCFIIDPIDGTTNFIKGFQHSAVCVGVAVERALRYGVVYDPDLDNLYYAETGKGAFLNGRPIHVSDCDLAHSLVLFGTCPYDHELSHKSFLTAEKVFYQSLEVRRAGSAALDICYVAAGKADLYFEMILRPWDWAGANVILREAGGFSATMENTPLNLNRLSSYLCGNADNVKEFYELYEF